MELGQIISVKQSIKRERQTPPPKESKSHNCNRDWIVGRHSKHRASRGPDPWQGLVVVEKARKPLVLLWLPYTWQKTRLEVWSFLIRKSSKGGGLGIISTLGA
jgi:hypothetical protein